MISGVHNCTTWNLCKDIIIHSLAQTNFYYISKIWFQDSTPAQPEIFVDDMVVHYTPTTWLSRHLYNLISGFYTCTTWNLYLYGKVTYFTLHSHTLTFIPFAKHDFRGFFISIRVFRVCFFAYTYFVLIFMSKPTRRPKSSLNSCLPLFLRHVIHKTKEHILHKWGFIVFYSKKQLLYNE